MAGISHNCKPNHPCPICGKPDYCNWVEFPNGDVRYDCHRMEGAVGDIKAFAGGLYYLQKISPNGFFGWEPLEQHERFEAERQKNKKAYSKNRATAPAESGERKEIKETGVVEPLPPEELDERYRALFKLLVLEDKHYNVLNAEWGKVPGLTDRILSRYPVKSLPPYDYVRFSSEEKLRNKSRKRIIGSLVETFGDMKGVRGFYQKESGNWEIACKGGILYPELDENGYIVGLRYADDYPTVSGELDGRAGNFTYGRDGDSPAGWYFTDSNGSKELVWTYGAPDNRIGLNLKGYPEGKVNGKYKAVSSYRMVKVSEDETSVTYANSYSSGTRHVTRPSLYTCDGDNCGMFYVTEGEKKAIVANTILNAPVASIPGVGSIGALFEPVGQKIIESLKAKGMKILVIVLDADKNENMLVLKAQEKGVKQALANGLNIAIGEWNPLWGKGFDDTLISGVKPKIYPVR